ncbi:MAG: hypothetical protein M3022_12410, partial [Actinomycetota bacterium]|nr:hypothetical protein [Actinomycetota bacterium]
IWLFRPVKPVLAAYSLPQDEQTHAARSRTAAHHGSSDLAAQVDWSPAEVWGPLDKTPAVVIRGSE